MIPSSQDTRRLLAIALFAGAIICAVVLNRWATWFSGDDDRYIDLILSGRGTLVHYARTIAFWGLLPIVVLASILSAVPVALFLSKPRGIVRKIVFAFCAIVFGFVSWVYWEYTHSRPPAITWVHPVREEKDGLIYKTFYSQTSESEVSYLVYLPDEYKADSDRRFPVVYFLPGASGNPQGCRRFVRQLRAASVKGECPPMIVIGVNGIAGSTYRDPPLGRAPVESVIVRDLIPHIDASYRTIPNRAARAVEGVSMGGFGALYLGLKYPDLFGVVSSWASPFYGNDIWQLTSDSAVSIRGRTKIRLICGTNDNLFRPIKAYHRWLDRLKIPHEFIPVEGAGHSIPEPLVSELDPMRFFVGAFRQADAQQ